MGLSQILYLNIRSKNDCLGNGIINGIHNEYKFMNNKFVDERVVIVQIKVAQWSKCPAIDGYFRQKCNDIEKTIITIKFNFYHLYYSINIHISIMIITITTTTTTTSSGSSCK